MKDYMLIFFFFFQAHILVVDERIMVSDNGNVLFSKTDLSNSSNEIFQDPKSDMMSSKCSTQK